VLFDDHGYDLVVRTYGRLYKILVGSLFEVFVLYQRPGFGGLRLVSQLLLVDLLSILGDVFSRVAFFFL
jgi:hypothetical protein